MQFSFGDRDLEQGVAHMKATAAQNLMHSSLLGKKKNTRLSVFKDEMQVPPSGHHGEMRIKRLLEARRLTQARANKEFCVTFVFTWQPSPGQGSDNQDCSQRKGNAEPTVSTSCFIFLTLSLPQGLFTKRSVQTAEPHTARHRLQSSSERSLWLSTH